VSDQRGGAQAQGASQGSLGRPLPRYREEKSGSRDEVEGAMNRAKGRIEKAAGVLTGDEDKKAEGHIDRTKGTAKSARGR
jgi:uncharacterized protein YjbJ (UPF0337 family)